MTVQEIDRLPLGQAAKEYMKAGCPKCGQAFQFNRVDGGIHGYCSACEPHAVPPFTMGDVSITSTLREPQASELAGDQDLVEETSLDPSVGWFNWTLLVMVILATMGFGGVGIWLVITNYPNYHNYPN